MRLLEKTQINEKVNAERKNVIDSGIFLATKVDKLREELLNLEKKRADFIKGSREAIDLALGDLQKRKSDLETDIKEATKQLAKLREPLDEEWAKLEKLKDEVIQIKLDSESYFQDLIKERHNLQATKDETDRLNKEAKDNESRTSKLLRETEDDRKEAKRLLGIARDLTETKEADIYNREVAMSVRESSLQSREDQLKRDRLEFNKEKKLLAIKKQRIR